VDFLVSDQLAEHRDAARAWVAKNVRPEWVADQRRTGTRETLALDALLARDGILGAGWPAQYGGSDVDPNFALAIFDELKRIDLAMDAWATTAMVLHTIDHLGTEAQKRHYIASALRGELLVALGYSEPDSGSDVAAAKTTAVRDGDDWVINGQKMFTSTAQVCSHVFVLARTNLRAAKHKGLTLFLVPTRCPGYEIQPVHTLGGERTNATFYTDVRVPDDARIGGVDEGWAVMHVALVYERGMSASGPITPPIAEELARWARTTRRPDGTTYFDDPLTAERIGRVAVDEEVTRLLYLRTRWQATQGELPGVEGSMAKLFATEASQRHLSDVLDLLAPEGLLRSGTPGAPAGGAFEARFRKAVVGTIYAGSSEILREIIAERRLRLPRNRASR